MNARVYYFDEYNEPGSRVKFPTLEAAEDAAREWSRVNACKAVACVIGDTVDQYYAAILRLDV